MVTAIVLIQVQRAYIEDTAQAISHLEGVSEVYTVAGEWDVVAMVRVRTHEEIADVVASRMLHIPGIDRTKTLVALRSYSTLDLESLLAAAAKK